MNIIKRFGTFNKSRYNKREIKYIVIHYTAGTTSKKGAAQNTALWYTNSACQCSSDFIVDDSDIVQYNGDIKNTYTWHCGGEKYTNKGGKLYGIATNANSIGIEICCNNSSGSMTYPNDVRYTFSDSAIDNTVELVRYLMKKYSIPPENVIRHYDTTGKLCPGIIGWNEESGNVEAWEKFKERISEGEYIYRVQVGAYKNRQSAENHAKRVGGFVVKEKIN